MKTTIKLESRMTQARDVMMGPLLLKWPGRARPMQTQLETCAWCLFVCRIRYSQIGWNSNGGLSNRYLLGCRKLGMAPGDASSLGFPILTASGCLHIKDTPLHVYSRNSTSLDPFPLCYWLDKFNVIITLFWAKISNSIRWLAAAADAV